MYGLGSGLSTGPSGLNSDFGVDDLVDLDNFLENYLTQLHSDQRPQVPGEVPMPGMPGPSGAMAPNLNAMQPTPGFGYGPQMGLGMGLGLGVGMGQAPQPGGQFYGMQTNPARMPVTTALATEPPKPLKPSAAAKATTRRGRSNSRQAREPEPSEDDDEDLSSGDSASSEDEKRSKKKKEQPVDDADRKHNALQEKNRKAQRRFRERQKTKLQELHKQIEELTGKVSSLQTENQALHSRTSILEKVLDMRNEQIQVMQENKEVTEQELATMAPAGAQLVPLTPDMMKELSSDEIYKIYQTYVKELSVKLVDANTRSDAPGAQELEKLVRDLSVMIMRLGVAKPLETRKFIVFSRQYLGNTEKEVIELWKTVMKNIDLTQQQMREIVELKRMFLQKIEPIMDERKHLNVSIQSNLPHDTFHTKNSISYIKAHEAVSKLRDNLRAEQHVVLEFAVAVFRGVFKPKQMATLLVKCYPAVPDALGIASALAAELGEPDSPATNQLTMQLGGYQVGNNSNMMLGTNYLTIHPSLLPNNYNASGSGQQPPTYAGMVAAADGMAQLLGVVSSSSSGDFARGNSGPPMALPPLDPELASMSMLNEMRARTASLSGSSGIP